MLVRQLGRIPARLDARGVGFWGQNGTALALRYGRVRAGGEHGRIFTDLSFEPDGSRLLTSLGAIALLKLPFV